MTAFEDIRDRALEKLLDKGPVSETQMELYIHDVIEEMETSRQFEVNRVVDTAVTVTDQRRLGTTDYGGMQTAGRPNRRRIIGFRETPWYANGDLSLGPMEWLPVSDPERPKFYSDKTDVKGPPRYIEVLDTGENAGTSTSGLTLQVWPLPDGLSPGGTEYTVSIPAWKRQLLASGNDGNWFVERCRFYLELEASARGMFFNEDYDRAMLQTTRAAGELKRLVRIEKLNRVKTRTLAPVRGVRSSVMAANRGLR